MSNYCVIARQLLASNPPPYKNFICDVWESPEFAGVMFLRLYADNLADFGDYQIAGITEWLNSVKRLLNQHPLIKAKWAHIITEGNPHV